MTAALGLLLAGCGNAIDTTATAPPVADEAESTLPLSSYRVRGDGTLLSAGKAVPVQPDAVTGYIDNAIPEGKEIALAGWAASGDRSSPADAVVAFVKRKVVAAIEPTGPRPDVVDGYDEPGLQNSGYLLRIPVNSLDCGSPDQGLTVVAIYGDKSAPLEWLANTRQAVADEC